MALSVQPVVITADLARLQRFYVELLDAVQVARVPPDGPAFFVGLRIGDSHLGLVADAGVVGGHPQRMLLSVEVENVDEMVPRVAAAGGTVSGAPNDLPWGQRVVHLCDPDGNTVNLTQQL